MTALGVDNSLLAAGPQGLAGAPLPGTRGRAAGVSCRLEPRRLALAMPSCAKTSFLVHRQASGTSTAPATTAFKALRPRSASMRVRKIQFKIDTDATAYSIKIYRLGYYQGDGAR